MNITLIPKGLFFNVDNTKEFIILDDLLDYLKLKRHLTLVYAEPDDLYELLYMLTTDHVSIHINSNSTQILKLTIHPKEIKFNECLNTLFDNEFLISYALKRKNNIIYGKPNELYELLRLISLHNFNISIN